MNFKEFQLEGFLKSETEYQSIEKLIFEQYREAGRMIDERLQKLFLTLQSGGITPENQYNWLIQYDRNIKLKKEIADIYTRFDLSTMGLTAKSGEVAISNNYYRQLFTLQWAAPISFAKIPDKIVEYAVKGQIDAWKQLSEKSKAKYLNSGVWPPSSTLTELFAKNRKTAILNIQRQINAGMVIGEGYAKISKRVAGIIGKANNTQASGVLSQARTIVRTEGSRLLNEGSFANTLEASSQGARIQKMWDATLDSATRPAHGAADGQKRNPEEPFIVNGESLMFPGDSAGSVGNIVNERCTTTDIVDGMMPTERRGRNPVTGENEVFGYKNYDQWAKDNGLSKNKYGQYYGDKPVKQKGMQRQKTTENKLDFIFDAKTNREAAEQIKKAIPSIKGVSYGKINIETTNKINESLYKNHKKYGDVGITTIRPTLKKGNMAAGVKRHEDGRISRTFWLNQDELSSGSLKDLNKSFFKSNKDGFLESSSLSDAVTHEYGHFMQYKGKTVSQIKDINKNIGEISGLKDGISRYGKTSGEEAMAEIFVRYDKGFSITPVQRKALRDYLGV